MGTNPFLLEAERGFLVVLHKHQTKCFNVALVALCKSGKSTFLNAMMGGALRTAKDNPTIRGRGIKGPAPSRALFPWSFFSFFLHFLFDSLGSMVSIDKVYLIGLFGPVSNIFLGFHQEGPRRWGVTSCRPTTSRRPRASSVSSTPPTERTAASSSPASPSPALGPRSASREGGGGGEGRTRTGAPTYCSCCCCENGFDVVAVETEILVVMPKRFPPPRITGNLRILCGRHLNRIQFRTFHFRFWLSTNWRRSFSRSDVEFNASFNDASGLSPPSGSPLTPSVRRASDPSATPGVRGLPATCIYGREITVTLRQVNNQARETNSAPPEMVLEAPLVPGPPWLKTPLENHCQGLGSLFISRIVGDLDSNTLPSNVQQHSQD